MTIDRVTYSGTFPTIQYGNHRPEFSAALQEGDDPLECMQKLFELACKFVEKNDPNMINVGAPPNAIPYDNGKGSVMMVIEKDNPSDILTAIQSSTTLEELTSYKLLAGNNDELKQAYMLKVKQLTNGTKEV